MSQITEPQIIAKKIEQDDRTLLEMFKIAKVENEEVSKRYEKIAKNIDENDYLSFHLAWLAKEFAKEKYVFISNEMKSRGLLCKKA